MTKSIIALVISLAVFCVSGIALAHEDIDAIKNCPYCNMDREKFAHSRMLVEYDDGTTVGTCSIHCLAIDLANNIDKGPVTLMIGDYNTKELISAEEAVWVIGGAKPGVMTKRAKWAFGDQAAAEAFITENGGALASFDDAMKAAYESMYEDTKMIREKRKMKRMKQAGTQ